MKTSGFARLVHPSHGRSVTRFRHVADVRRVNLESQEETRVFYDADMQVDWLDPGAPEAAPTTSGTIASLSRSGDMAAAWDGATFAPQEGWNAGNRGPLVKQVFKVRTRPNTIIDSGPTDPTGAIDQPVNPMKQLIAAGASFVARTTHTNPNHVLQMMEAAMDHDGFSVIECLSECIEPIGVVPQMIAQRAWELELQPGVRRLRGEPRPAPAPAAAPTICP